MVKHCIFICFSGSSLWSNQTKAETRLQSQSMENREELRSIAPFLPPFLLHSSSLLWPPAVVEALKALSKGPAHSNVNSGQLLFLAVSDLRNSLSLFSSLSPFASHGYSVFFDDLMARADAARWFEEVLPRLADLLLRLPCLLEGHYKQNGAQTGLRLLEPQQPGSVLLTQELIGALLTCALFCLFPTTNRGAKHLPTINFDHLFACLYESYDERIESKIKCITHYFERICSSMPVGTVTFERKVLPFELSPFCVSYPEDDFWSRSTVPLCCFEVHSSGFIEDQSNEALEVDFANKYLGGGALGRGAVQEEIRFMINPELIAGMLFLPAMAKNEAIEIVGTERFSNYTGYAGSFRFSGDYVDKKGFDSIKRRKTRIIAIDALCSPGNRQYAPKFLLREINKAFCGFLDQNKGQQWKKLFQDNGFLGPGLGQDFENPSERSTDNLLPLEDPSTSLQTSEGATGDQLMSTIAEEKHQHMDCNGEIGVATGNWGCGAFGGDPELKAIIQWLAASQALRPFISYYTFGLESLQKLDQVTRWIISHQWTVGDLWDMLVQYASQRLKGDTTLGFFSWLLPSLCRRCHGVGHDSSVQKRSQL